MKVAFEADSFLGRQASSTARAGRHVVEGLLRLEPEMEITLLLRS